MKLLAFSDLHGNLKALKILRKRISNLNFDLLICGGDLTNFYFDSKELEKISFFEEFIYSMQVPFLIVFGNRDYNRHLNKRFPLKISFNLDEADYYFEGWHFTSQVQNIKSNSILVSHSKILNLKNKIPVLQLWGDTHIAKILYRTHPCVDLGFLYRDEIRGQEPMLGLYWIIDISSRYNLKINWFPLEINVAPEPFFVLKGKNDVDEYILPWYLKDNKNYIEKILGNSV